MSAEQHRQEADKEMAQAHVEAVRATVAPTLPAPPLAPRELPAYPLEVYNPGEQHMTRARQLEAHARQHQAAAGELEATVQDECRPFPAETRAVCPMLGPVSELSDLPNGVRVLFVPHTRVDAVAAHMRCHFAYAQSHGFDTLIPCPLYVRGLQIHVSDDDRSIDLTGPDETTARMIRAHARDQAVIVRP